ncbi:hypothetical protein DL768_010251 [Monosporascus sp. mg162]|nr:hypothetical protein DL768_010251 [Monosporascus sp. mg162]
MSSGAYARPGEQARPGRPDDGKGGGGRWPGITWRGGARSCAGFKSITSAVTSTHKMVNVSTIPRGVTREAAVALLQDHDFFLRCDPHYASHSIAAPHAAAGTAAKAKQHYRLPAEIGEPLGAPAVKCYEVVDVVENPFFASNVRSEIEIADFEHGIFVRIRSKGGVVFDTIWSVRRKEEGKEEKGEGEEEEGELELVQDATISAPMPILSVVRGQVEKNKGGLHKKIIGRLVEDRDKGAAAKENAAPAGASAIAATAAASGVKEHFNLADGYLPLNHGSFGTYPKTVLKYQRSLQLQTEARPDTSLRYTNPKLLKEAGAAIAPLLGVQTEEVVFVPIATHGHEHGAEESHLMGPRGCTVLHVPLRDQRIIHTFPTSWGCESPLERTEMESNDYFVRLFEKVSTTDNTPYLCVPAALKFREDVCGAKNRSPATASGSRPRRKTPGRDLEVGAFSGVR